MPVGPAPEEPRTQRTHEEGDGEHGIDVDARVLVLRAEELVLEICCEDRVGVDVVPLDEVSQAPFESVECSPSEAVFLTDQLCFTCHCWRLLWHRDRNYAVNGWKV